MAWWHGGWDVVRDMNDRWRERSIDTDLQLITRTFSERGRLGSLRPVSVISHGIWEREVGDLGREKRR